MTALALSADRKITFLEKPGKEPRIAKRILVSGNGRCNYFNARLLRKDAYADPLLAPLSPFVFQGKRNRAEETLAFLSSLGFEGYPEGDLLYPYFNRAESFYSLLMAELRKKNPVFLSGTALKADRKRKTVTYLTEDGKEETISYQDAVFAPGGRSYDRSDFRYGLLDSLGIPYVPFSPSLCPIVTEEKIPSYLSRSRLKGLVSFFADGKKISEEDGEVIFKEDGLSGIAVFDGTAYLNLALREKKKARITVSLDYAVHDGKRLDPKTSLASYPLFLSRYLSERKLAPLSPLSFTFRSLYPFEQSQASFGGIAASAIDPKTMALRDDPHFYALGEVLDLNFICGGYHIGSTLLEGYLAGKALSSHGI